MMNRTVSRQSTRPWSILLLILILLVSVLPAGLLQISVRNAFANKHA
jgi:hypothetical protein